ncbi:MAG: NUDIX hydrolase [Deltaproteobacteria bacterium]|nr:MAG: NUDIX hydrolase [Deltaproteobacteria bacterium]
MREYRAGDWPRPSVAVDLVVFTVLDTDLKVLVIRRDVHPFKGAWALPGGFVRVGAGEGERGEDVYAAAQRELAEETGLDPATVYLEQLYTFGAPDRDPRMRVISVAHYALVRPTLAPLVVAGTDAAAVRWRSVAAEAGEPLAFDHDEILRVALERVRGKVDYAPIAFELVPETFTVAELRSVYEAIKGTTYDAGNFRRRFKRMQTDGVIAQAPGKRTTGTKPARVYRFVREGLLARPDALADT